MIPMSEKDGLGGIGKLRACLGLRLRGLKVLLIFKKPG
jgi:hypothetical protein